MRRNERKRKDRGAEPTTRKAGEREGWGEAQRTGKEEGEERQTRQEASEGKKKQLCPHIRNQQWKVRKEMLWAVCLHLLCLGLFDQTPSQPGARPGCWLGHGGEGAACGCASGRRSPRTGCLWLLPVCTSWEDVVENSESINTSLRTVVTEDKVSDNFQELLLTEKAKPQSNREKRVFL